MTSARPTRYHARCGKKNANGSGTDARCRKDGRYETRATLDTPPAAGRWPPSTYGRYERTVRNHLLPFFKRLV